MNDFFLDQQSTIKNFALQNFGF